MTQVLAFPPVIQRIGIIGTGAVARFLAHRFLSVGAQVSVLSLRAPNYAPSLPRTVTLRDERALACDDLVAQDSLISYPLEHLYTSAERFFEQPFDVLFMCAKNTFNTEICANIVACVERSPTMAGYPVVLCQNGFLIERAFEHLPARFALYRAVLNFAVQQYEGVTEVIFLKTSFLGDARGPDAASAQASMITPRLVAQALTVVGIGFEASNTIEQRVFDKNALNAAASVCGMVRGGIQATLRNPECDRLVNAILVECAALGQQLGYITDVPAFVALSRQYLASIPDFTSSLVKDVLNQRVTESDSLVGSLVREGVRLGVATPNLAFLQRFFDVHNGFVDQASGA